MDEEKKQIAFEEAMAELESLVQKLDEGDLGLEESLEVYERAVELRDMCRKRLEEYDRRVSKLMEKDEELEIEDFD